MGLLVNAEFKGIEIAQAYARIKIHQVTPGGIRCIAEFSKSKEHDLFDAYEFLAPYSETVAGVFSQAYTYAKTLPKFAGAVDVFEGTQPP